MTRKQLLNFLVVLLYSFNAKALSTDTIFTKDKFNAYIGLQSEVLIDDSDTMTLQDVINSPLLQKSTTLVSNLGAGFGTAWIQFVIHNNIPEQDYILNIENSFLQNVTLYNVSSNGQLIYKDSVSKDLPFWERKSKVSNPFFQINIPPGTSKKYLLKIKSPTQLIVPIRLGTMEGALFYELMKAILRGIYFGVVLGIMFYNLFIYYSTKDKSYLYFIFYMVSVGLVQLSITGYGFKYIWPFAPNFEKLSLFIFPTLTTISSIGFTRYFLYVKDYLPRFNKVLSGINLLYILLTLNAFWGNQVISYNLLNILGLPLALMLIGAGVYIWTKHRYRPALVFLIAWALFLVSVIVFVLKDVGVLPYNLITISSLQLGSGATIILLSIAVADKINLYKMQKENFQRQAIDTAKENERILKEQNVVLETNVKERTKELQSSNLHLEKTLKELKETELYLVESEKMASLGQLTAGIAHEINNPINFVTSNVNPLRRDIEVIKDIVVKIEMIGLQESSNEEKLALIKGLKEEEEYDYIIKEIEFLLKGIQEGASRTSEIVKGLRLFSRLDEDSIKLVNINEGLDATLTIINNLLQDKITVTRHFDENALIECYPGKLNQVFLNTLTNAVHAIQERWKQEPKGSITIETKRTEDKFIVTFKDNGIGMTEETKKKLFEPFFTTKQVGVGTGLGLSISWNTIMKHNGDIQVDTQYGEGTSFSYILPIHASKNEITD